MMPMTSTITGRVPDHLYIEITDQCNLRCKHCYLSAGPDGSRMIEGALIQKALANYAEIGGHSVAFSGGEPLLHPDLLNFVAFAGLQGLHATVVTNGTLLQEPVDEFLLNCGATLAISVEGPDAETHDAIRGAGSFKQVIAMLDRIMARGAQDSLIICFTPTRQNVHTLFSLAAWLSRNGYRRLYISLLEERGRELGNKLALSLDHIGRVQLLTQLSLLLTATDLNIEIDAGHLRYFFNRLLYGTADRDPMESTLRISPSGQVYLTAYIDDAQFSLGNLNEKSLLACWQTGRYHNLLKEAEKRGECRLPECKNCYYWHVCAGGNPVRAYAMHGTFSLPDDLCEAKTVFLNRWYSASC